MPNPRTSKNQNTKNDKEPAPAIPEFDQPGDAFDYYVALARSLGAERVQPCRADVALAFHNLKLGVGAIRPHAERVRAEMPKVPLDDVLHLPGIGLALLVASNAGDERATLKGEVAEKLRELRALREPMLMIAEAFVMLGLLPSDRVKAIRAGTGPLDAAMDGVALAALYRDHDSTIANKHPFSTETLDNVARLGGWLVQRVTPSGGREAVEAAPSEAVDLRNRFWSLVVERHAHARKIGFYLFDERVDEMVPPLQSRVLGRRGADTDAPAQDPSSSVTSAP